MEVYPEKMTVHRTMRVWCEVLPSISFRGSTPSTEKIISVIPYHLIFERNKTPKIQFVVEWYRKNH